MTIRLNDVLFYAGGECFQEFGTAVWRMNRRQGLYTHTGGGGGFVDKNGVLRQASAGRLRVEYADGVPGILLEPAASNLLLQSADFGTTWSPSGSPTITTDAETAPNGVAEADNIEDTGAGVQSVVQNVTIPDDSESYVFSVFVHKTAHSDDIGQLQITLQNGTPVGGAMRFDPGAGTVAAHPTSSPDDFGIEDYSADFWRVWVTRINNASGNTNAQLIVAPAAAATLGGVTDSAQAGDATFWGAQLEVGTEPGSHIPTTTVAVSFDSDLFHSPFPHPPTSFADRGGTLYAKWIEQGTRAKALAQASAAWVVCVGNTTPRWAVAYSATGLLEGGFRNAAVLRTSAIDVSGDLSQGDLVEAVVNLHPDGSVRTFAEITSGGVPGGVLTGSQSAAQPEDFVAAWQQDRIYLNTGLGGGALSSHGFAAFPAVKVFRGIHTLDETRAVFAYDAARAVL
jgi:hypothetical protein